MGERFDKAKDAEIKNFLHLPDFCKFEKRVCMNIIEKRKRLHEYIDNSDERILDSLYSYFQKQEKVSNNFIKNYNDEIDQAMEGIDKGFFVTHEEVEKESEQW